jgi:hypothetical protein
MDDVIVGGIYMCGFFKKMFIVNTLGLNDFVTVSWIGDVPSDAKEEFSTDAMSHDYFVGMSTDLLKVLT